MKKIIGFFMAAIMVSTFLGGCGSKDNESNGSTNVDIKEIHEKVKNELGEDYFPDSEISNEQLKDQMEIDMDNVKEYIAESPMISVNIDMFIAMEAKEGKGEEVEADLNEYKEYMANNAMMYPMNIAKVSAAKVVRHGDYVFFIMLGKYDDRDDATEEEAFIFAKEEVKKVEDIINSFFK